MARIRCLVGHPPKNRPLAKTGLFKHMGFDHRAFRDTLKSVFYDVQEYRSPFPRLPSGLNSQMLVVCH